MKPEEPVPSAVPAAGGGESEPAAAAAEVAKPKEAPASGSKAATPAKAGGGMPLWNMILLGLAGVLVVVTVVAKMGQKKRGGGKSEGEGAAP